MLRNLAISLIQEERIETTITRAKELRRVAERLVTYAKRGDLHGRRLIVSRLGNQPSIASKLVDDIAPRYKNRAGGYTRILKTGFRRGDASPVALIEWVEAEAKQRPKRKTSAKSDAPSAATTVQPEAAANVEAETSK
jgi:large subunit ribosomal protein L17